MKLRTDPAVEVPARLLEAIRSFPLVREVEHCGRKLSASPFAFYAVCPRCSAQIKLRAMSACPEIEDVFDAVFEWMARPAAAELARRRQAEIQADEGE